MENFIRPTALAKQLSISKRTLFRLMKQPEFPKKVRISKQVVAFRESEVEEWLEKNTESINRSGVEKQ